MSTSGHTTVTVSHRRGLDSIGGGSGMLAHEGTITEQFPSASSSHSVDMPATVNAGDLLLLFFSANDSPSISTPSGWTKIYDHSSFGIEGACFAKDADGSEDGTSVSVSIAASKPACAQVMRFSGWHGTISGGVEGTSRDESGGTIPDPPNLTPSWGGAENIWIAVRHSGSDDVTSSSGPANYTNLQDVVSGAGSGNGCSLGTARRTLDASSEDPSSFQLASHDVSVTATVAVRPA